MTEYGVVLFFTTSSATQAEKVLGKAGLGTKLIPTPRQYSSDCGISLRFMWADHDKVKPALEEAKVEMHAIYPL